MLYFVLSNIASRVCYSLYFPGADPEFLEHRVTFHTVDESDSTSGDALHAALLLYRTALLRCSSMSRKLVLAGDVHEDEDYTPGQVNIYFKISFNKSDCNPNLFVN